jgi:MFS family permease
LFLATAAPVISSKFDALNRITWVITGISVFLSSFSSLTICFSIPRIHFHTDRIYSPFWPISCHMAYEMVRYSSCFRICFCYILSLCNRVYLISIFVFELGSLFCAIARNVDFLIFGRTVAGIGGAGIFVSIFALITQITRLKDRPVLVGFFGGVFGISSVCPLFLTLEINLILNNIQVIGPLIGGALTDNVSWRWCFYINLPIGGLSMLAIFLIIEARPAIFDQHGGETLSTVGRFRKLDIVGTVLSFAAICCFLLAIQWGGNERPWNSASVIALVCVSPIIFLFFIAWEHHVGDRAMMPLVLFTRKTQ